MSNSDRNIIKIFEKANYKLAVEDPSINRFAIEELQVKERINQDIQKT